MTRARQPKESIRTCIGCRKRSAPSALVRLALARLPESSDSARVVGPVVYVWPPELLLAPPTRKNGNHGRGAYVHPSFSCLSGLAQRGTLERAFRFSRGVFPHTKVEGLLRAGLGGIPELSGVDGPRESDPAANPSGRSARLGFRTNRKPASQGEQPETVGEISRSKIVKRNERRD